MRTCPTQRSEAAASQASTSGAVAEVRTRLHQPPERHRHPVIRRRRPLPRAPVKAPPRKRANGGDDPGVVRKGEDDLAQGRRPGRDAAIRSARFARSAPVRHISLPHMSSSPPAPTDQLLRDLRDRVPGSEHLFDAVVGALNDAVTIRDRDGRILYANRAALDHMGFATWAEMREMPAGRIMADYDVTDEQGQPVPMERLPSVRLLRGETAEPLLIRTVHRGTGAVHWNLLKASPLRGSDGSIEATIMIIEDVTEQRLAAVAGGVHRARHHGARLLARLRADPAECGRAGGARDRRLVRRRPHRRARGADSGGGGARRPRPAAARGGAPALRPRPPGPGGRHRPRAAHRRTGGVSRDHRRDARGRRPRRAPPRAAALGGDALGRDRPGAHRQSHAGHDDARPRRIGPGVAGGRRPPGHADRRAGGRRDRERPALQRALADRAHAPAEPAPSAPARAPRLRDRQSLPARGRRAARSAGTSTSCGRSTRAGCSWSAT